MRTLGTQSAFDVIVVITLGGILGRCIMGHYPFFSSLPAAAALALLHQNKGQHNLAYDVQSARHLIASIQEQV